MKLLSIIPSKISDLIQVFESKEYSVNKTPIETDYILEELFSKRKTLLPHIQRVWHLIDEGDLFHVWVIQSEKWNRKSWRRRIARNFQMREFADQLIFFVPSGEEWSVYSLIVVTEEGLDPIDIINPKNPSMEVSRFWEQVLNTDFSFSIYESVSLAQQTAHALTAQKIFNALEISQEETLGVFEEAGLKIERERFVIPRQDSPLSNAIIDIQPYEPKPEEFLKKNLSVYIETSRKLYKSIDLICLLTKNGLIIADTNGRIYGTSYQKENGKFILKDSFSWKLKGRKVKEEKKKAFEILTSLIAVIDKRPVFNAETYASQNGRWSPISVWAQNLLLDYFNENREKIEVLYSEWERRFSEVYKKNDTTVELFIKHTYLAFLVKLVLLEQFSEKISSKNPTFSDLLEYLNNQKISLFAHDFFHWADNVPLIHEFLYDTIHGADFDSTDIFRVIYQQMVSPSTRHALGEFYTPPRLCQLMVDETYKLGVRVLDPACGSGTFLVEIIKNIRRAGLEIDNQLNAIKKLYGFDINPIAVAVSKANILLQINAITDQSIPLNIYLANSIFPLEHKKQQKLDIGSYFVFPMVSINQSFEIPTIFYSEELTEKFGDLLRNLDLLLLREWESEKDFLNELKSMLLSSEYDWLNIKSGMKPLKEIFIGNVANKIFNLCHEDRNHIWSYLLFNSIGIAQTRGKIDLVIGNPPWLVLNGVYSKDYRERLKDLAKILQLKPKASNVANLEMSALFFYQANKVYLKEGGSLALVVSKAFITGSQHDATRKFTDNNNIKIWNFSEDIFRIRNICIFTKKSKNSPEDQRLYPEISLCKVGRNKKGLTFAFEEPEKYFPARIIRDNKNILIGVERFISAEEKKSLLPRSKKNNNYYSICTGGIHLKPRTFSFVKIQEENESEVLIEPNMDFQARDPWKFRPFSKAWVEREYIHQMAKSTELVPFLFLDFFPTFLPVDDNNFLSFKGDSSELKPKAKIHFQLLKEEYKKHHKEGAAITDYWVRINYSRGLTNKKLKFPFKVVTPSSGSFVKSALIRGKDILLDCKLYYYPTESLNEGLYLVGVLNAPCVTRDVSKRAASGFGGKPAHLHKRPWELLIPKYNEKNELHRQIVQLSKKIEEKVINLANNWRKEEFEKLKKKKPDLDSYEEVSWRPITVQRLIKKDLEIEYLELDKLVGALFIEV